MTRARTLSIAVLMLFAAVAAQASWYDDYDAGIAAARKGQWAVVQQKMTAAIKGNPNENNKARTYGAIFINYHPYYYRGVANLNLGNYEAAISDLERTSGPGEVDLGPIGDLLQRAKSRLEAQNATPEPQPPAPVPQPVRPTPVPVPVPQPVVPTPQPVAPTIDPALRSRASSAISSAREKLAAAQRRKATASPQYAQALTMITDANTRNATAKSNDDLANVIAIAENAALIADSAMAPGVTPAVVTPKPVVAANAALADTSRQLRRALENYFAGEFEAATKDFDDLSRQLPTNGWIWAFLGASQYSQYAFEADDRYKNQAIESFKKAKRYGKWSNGLPTRYFSKRIRKAFNEVG